MDGTERKRLVRKLEKCGDPSNDQMSYPLPTLIKVEHEISDHEGDSLYGEDTLEDIDLCDLKSEYFIPKSESVVENTPTNQSGSSGIKIMTKNEFKDILRTLPHVGGYIYEMKMPEKKTSEETKEFLGDIGSQRSYDSNETFIEDFSIKPKIEYALNLTESQEENKKDPVATSVEDNSKFIYNKRKKAKKRVLSVSQMHKIVQNDNGFFSNKKHFMTKEALKLLSYQDKVFLSCILRKFIKRKNERREMFLKY